MKQISNKDWARIEKILVICQKIAHKKHEIDAQTKELEELARLARETKKSQTHRLKDIRCVSWGDEIAVLTYEMDQYLKDKQ